MGFLHKPLWVDLGQLCRSSRTVCGQSREIPPQASCFCGAAKRGRISALWRSSGTEWGNGSREAEVVPTSKSRATPGDTKGSRQGLRSIPVLKLAVRSIELSGPGYDGQAPEISILTVVSAESRTDLSPGHVGALRSAPAY
jgi:hypothetical protein